MTILDLFLILGTLLFGLVAIVAVLPPIRHHEGGEIR